MPESAHEWFSRVQARLGSEGHRDVGWQSLRTWPLEGELTPRTLEPPGDERERGGAAGADCFMCSAASGQGGDYLVWTDDLLMVGVPHDDVAIPMIAFLMPCAHHDLADLPADVAARMGELLVACERAAMDALDVPRLQVFRYGEGQEHLHWWLLGRPRGMAQLSGAFLPLWEDLLPTRSRSELRADLLLVAERLVSLVGGRVLA